MSRIDGDSSLHGEPGLLPLGRRPEPAEVAVIISYFCCTSNPYRLRLNRGSDLIRNYCLCYGPTIIALNVDTWTCMM